MERIITFKDPGTSITVPGIGVVNSSNLTPGLYDRLVAISPNHVAHFNVKNVKPKTETKSK